MSDPLPDPPALDPADLATRKFGKARKGLEPAEVRAELGRAADALRVWQERDARMRARVEELEAALDAANVLTDDRVAMLLGGETVKVIQAAREAAEEIRRRAEEEAAADAAAVRDAARTDKELAEAEAEQLRAEVLRAAEAELAAARREGRQMVAEARAVRERMLRDLAERRRTARQQIEAARAGRDQILAALRSAGSAVDGVTLSLGDIDRDTQRAAERAALSVEDDVDRVLATLLDRLGDEPSADAGAPGAPGADVGDVDDSSGATTSAETDGEAAGVDTADGDAADGDGAPEDGAPDDTAARDDVDDAAAAGEGTEAGTLAGGTVAGGAAAGDPTATDAPDVTEADADDVVVELVVPVEDDAPEVPREVGGLALAEDVPSELAAARRTVGTDAEVIDFPSRRQSAGPAAGATTGLDDDLYGDDLLDDDLYDDLYGDHDFDLDDEGADGHGPGRGAEVVDLSSMTDDPDELPTAPSASVAATVHDLIERMRETVPAAPAPQVDAPATADPAIDTPAGPAMDTAADLATGPAIDPAHTAGVTAADTVAESGPLTDEQVRDRRDALAEPAARSVARTLKRLVTDEQNELLDRLRRTGRVARKDRPDVVALLGPAGEDVARYAADLLEPVRDAAGAGVQLWNELVGAARLGAASGGTSDAARGGAVTDDAVREVLVVRLEAVLALRRARVARLVEEADARGLDLDELAESVRSTYREWRSSSVDEAAGDLTTAGVALGTRAAAGEGTPCRWVPDHGGLPCADAEDNVLGGAVPCGAVFPTGDTAPPAHPGCRCLVVPAD